MEQFVFQACVMSRIQTSHVTTTMHERLQNSSFRLVCNTLCVCVRERERKKEFALRGRKGKVHHTCMSGQLCLYVCTCVRVCVFFCQRQRKALHTSKKNWQKKTHIHESKEKDSSTQSFQRRDSGINSIWCVKSLYCSYLGIIQLIGPEACFGICFCCHSVSVAIKSVV